MKQRHIRPSYTNVVCLNCKCVFYPNYYGKNKYQKYCSKSCNVRAQHKRKEIGFENKNPNYIDGRSSNINICSCGKRTNDYRNKLCQKCYIYKLIYLNKTRIRNYTKEYRQKMRKRMGIGKNHMSWKGDKVGYTGIHDWLSNIYGKANKCENLNCSYIKPKYFEWALLRKKEYERKRENFIRLCKGCHRKYDNNFKHKINIGFNIRII